MIRRLSLERWRKRGEDVVMPGEPEPRVVGNVFLSYDDNMEMGIITAVWVDLPARGFMRTINNMQKHGFWAPRPHSGKMVFVPAGKILQAELRPKE